MSARWGSASTFSLSLCSWCTYQDVWEPRAPWRTALPDISLHLSCSFSSRVKWVPTPCPWQITAFKNVCQYPLTYLWEVSYFSDSKCRKTQWALFWKPPLIHSKHSPRVKPMDFLFYLWFLKPARGMRLTSIDEFLDYIIAGFVLVSFSFSFPSVLSPVFLARDFFF